MRPTSGKLRQGSEIGIVFLGLYIPHNPSRHLLRYIYLHTTVHSILTVLNNRLTSVNEYFSIEHIQFGRSIDTIDPIFAQVVTEA